QPQRLRPARAGMPVPGLGGASEPPRGSESVGAPSGVQTAKGTGESASHEPGTGLRPELAPDSASHKPFLPRLLAAISRFFDKTAVQAYQERGTNPARLP